MLSDAVTHTQAIHGVDRYADVICPYALAGHRLLTNERVTEFAKFFNVAPATFLPS
jgi:hypothetical protein